MRVLFVGDTHGNTNFVKTVFGHAEESGVETIIQVGDFGWWPRNPAGERFIHTVSSLASQKKIPFYFIDGNHEDHHQLPHESTIEITEMEPELFWIPRGTTFEFGGTRFLGIGGAVSVDRQWRTEHIDWFREEVATFEQFHRAITATDIDIVVAHDVPTGVSLDLTYPTTPDIEAHCVSHRDGMAELRDTLEPERWIAGHYHQRVTDMIMDTTVEVLAHDAIRVEDSTLLVTV